eukprot:scaffold1813_cov109-Cylindrotheca_fusiformis.AAC.6
MQLPLIPPPFFIDLLQNRPYVPASTSKQNHPVTSVFTRKNFMVTKCVMEDDDVTTTKLSFTHSSFIAVLDGKNQDEESQKRTSESHQPFSPPQITSFSMAADGDGDACELPARYARLCQP